MSNIQVIATTQKIIVNPSTQSVSIIHAGPPGPRGYSGAGVQAGGTVGQTITKASGADYDTTWMDTIRIAQHGTNASFARPAGLVVYWLGSVEPLNALTNDLWFGGP